jgi:hypothetical protein
MPCFLRLAHYIYSFFSSTKTLPDKAMQRQTSTYQRDAPGQDTGIHKGHMSSYQQRGAPAERHYYL